MGSAEERWRELNVPGNWGIDEAGQVSTITCLDCGAAAKPLWTGNANALGEFVADEARKHYGTRHAGADQANRRW